MTEPTVPAFVTNIYSALHAAAQDPKLRHKERYHAIDLLQSLLQSFPQAWNERIEREIADLARFNVNAPEHLEILIGLLRQFADSRATRVAVTLMREAHAADHVASLLILLLECTVLFRSTPEIEDVWIETALIPDGPLAWGQVCIAESWLEARPHCKETLRGILQAHPTWALDASADIELFIVAPTSVAAITWAERVVEGWEIKSLPSLVSQLGELEVMLTALSTAALTTERPELRAQLETWVCELKRSEP